MREFEFILGLHVVERTLGSANLQIDLLMQTLTKAWVRLS